MIISTLLMIALKKQKKKRSHKKCLSAAAQKRRDRRILGIAIQQPNVSAFEILFGSGCDQSLIALAGFDHNPFRYLLARFETVFTTHTSYSTLGKIRQLKCKETLLGRPRILNAQNYLGLFLEWGSTRGSEKVLSILFGVSGSVCPLFILFARRIFIRALSKNERAEIRMSTVEEMHQFQHAIAET